MRQISLKRSFQALFLTDMIFKISLILWRTEGGANLFLHQVVQTAGGQTDKASYRDASSHLKIARLSSTYGRRFPPQIVALFLGISSQLPRPIVAIFFSLLSPFSSAYCHSFPRPIVAVFSDFRCCIP